MPRQFKKDTSPLLTYTNPHEMVFVDAQNVAPENVQRGPLRNLLDRVFRNFVSNDQSQPDIEMQNLFPPDFVQTTGSQGSGTRKNADFRQIQNPDFYIKRCELTVNVSTY